jgi:hypothetical protein
MQLPQERLIRLESQVAELSLRLARLERLNPADPLPPRLQQKTEPSGHWRNLHQEFMNELKVQIHRE